MLSKNNHKLRLQKLAATKQHFAIKKFTVGVASVLISSTFALYVSTQSQYVQADNASAQTSEQKSTQAQADLPSDKESSSQVLSGKQTTGVSTDKNKVAETKKAAQVATEKTQTSQTTPVKPAETTSSVTQVQKPQVTSADKSEKSAPTATSKMQAPAQTAVAPENDSQPQKSQAAQATSSVVSQPSNVNSPNKPADLQVQEKNVAPNANQYQDAVAPSDNNNQSKAVTDPQWTADAQKAVANKSGLYTPQLSYNAKWYTMAFDPGMVTKDVLTGNTLPFTVVNHRSDASAASSSAYKLRVQLDNRLANKVNGVSVSVSGDESKVVNFTRVVGDDNKPTNMWEANMIYSRGGIFGGGLVNAGVSQVAKNGKITLVDTVQNVLRQLPDVAKQPLAYNAYVYDDTSHTALLSTNNAGYVVGPGDPLTKVPVSTPEESKFNGAHSVVTYDPTVGKNGALVVFYQADKSYMWSYDNDWRLQLNYAIDPTLLPYLEKVNGARTVELDMLTGGTLPSTDGAYGFEKQYDKVAGKSVWRPLAYNSPLTKKVADLPFNDDGTGKLNPTNLGSYIDFQNGLLYHGRPAALRLVYRLNKKPSEIYTDLLKKGDSNGNLLFSEYYSTQDGTMQAYSLATGVVSFNDSDGDGLPDVKETTESTNPFVSMPNVSNVYGTEQKVHGQLVFSDVEKNPQKLTVTDKDGKVLGTTTVTPVKFNSLAQAQPFTVELNAKVNSSNSKLKVAVVPVLDTSDDVADNTVPQVTEVAVKAAPVGVTGKEYPLNASFLEDPKLLVANADQLPTDAKYSWVTKPDLTKSGNQQVEVKVSFADKYDPTYQHELVVPVLVKVADFDLKDGSFKVKAVTMHVNENSNTVPLTSKDLLSWTSRDGKKTLAGEPLWSLVKSVSWGESPVTNVAGKTTGFVSVATKDDQEMLASVDVNVVGAKAKTGLTVPWGQQLNAGDAVANQAELEQFGPVTYAWKKPLQVTPQPKEEHVSQDDVVVTYGDHTTELLPVSVQVEPSEAENFSKDKNVKFQPVVVGLNENVAANKALEGLVPAEQKNLQVVNAVFKDKVDTTNIGEKQVPATLTFADSSTAETNMPVKVVSQAQNYDPTVKKNLQVKLGETLTPESVLNPDVTLPKGTKVTWKVPVDTNKAGMQTGEVEVIYPDSSKDELPVQVKVGTDADAVTPKAKANVHAALNSKLAPESVLDPSVVLPQGTKVAWKTPVDTTKAGNQTGTLEVTYPDGSKDELPVQVKVGTDADAATPKAKKNLHVDLNGSLVPESVLDPSVVLPQGTKVAWKTPVDTTKAGSQTGTLEVTYPDNSKDELPVQVKVGTDADAVTPKVKANVHTALNSKLTPESVLDPSAVLPQGTKVTWKVPVDTTRAGSQTGTLEVTYPDGSKDELPFQVKVGTDADAVTPKVKANVHTALNSKLTPESVLDPSVAFPQGTKVAWKVPVDTTKVGSQAGTLEVTYPDGSKDELPVKVEVGNDADAVTPKAKANVHAALNSKLTPESVLDPNVALPQGTKVAWKTPVDTTKAGNQAGTLEVTYPDNSKDELPVQVKVGTDADAVTPKAKANVHTALNSKLTPESVLDPNVALPQGTKVAWKTPVDTTKAGNQTGTLEITYPDNSKDELPVQVKVGTDADAVTPKAKANVHTALNSKLTPESVLDPSVAFPQGTKVAWKVPVDTTKVGSQAGTLEVTYPDGSKDELPVTVTVDGGTKKNTKVHAAALNANQKDHSNNNNDQGTNLNQKHEKATKNVVNNQTQAVLKGNQKELSFKQTGQNDSSLEREPENGAKHVANNHKQVALAKKRSQSTKQALTKATKTSTELPQTGEKNSASLTLLGVWLGALLGLFGLTEATKDKSKKF